MHLLRTTEQDSPVVICEERITGFSAISPKHGGVGGMQPNVGQMQGAVGELQGKTVFSA
jgi:hypothetical protein